MNGRSFKGGEQKGNESYMETNTGSISVAESNHRQSGNTKGATRSVGIILKGKETNCNMKKQACLRIVTKEKGSEGKR